MINLFSVSKNDKIAVALSGGKDSVCLLHLLTRLKNQLNLTVEAINVEHGIRGDSSKSDSEFCKKLCKELNVPLFFREVDSLKYAKDNSLTVEQSARILRYGVFQEYLKTHEDFKIATAHHKNDNFETVLFNLFRGTGLKGLGGINNRNEIIRPLINCSREEIDNYIIENGLSYVTDETNFDTEYSRNFIRNEITPVILKKFPFAIDNVFSLSKTAREEDEYLDCLAEKQVCFNGKNYYLNNDLDAVLFKRATVIILKKLGVNKDYEAVHINGVFNLRNLKNGAKINLPKNVTAINEYGKITFYKTDGDKNLDISVPFDLGKFDFGFLEAELYLSSTYDGFYFDVDKIPQNAIIRNRKDGDVFKNFNGGTKKLKDFLIDKKIPQAKRDKLLLIADGNEVLLIFGVAISDKIKVDGTTKRICVATVKYK